MPCVYECISDVMLNVFCSEMYTAMINLRTAERNILLFYMVNNDKFMEAKIVNFCKKQLYTI